MDEGLVSKDLSNCCLYKIVKVVQVIFVSKSVKNDRTLKIYICY